MHLSDLHIKSKNSVDYEHIDKLLDALRTCGNFEAMFLILSGDIAFSGDQIQYSAASNMIVRIYCELKKKKIYMGHVNVFCVPGNHDIVFEEQPRTHEQLWQIYTENSYADSLESELSKQSYFFEFAQKNGCFERGALFNRQIINLNNYSVEVNLINSGVFSLRDEEDKGLHYIDQESLSEFNIPSSSDFVISVIHHAPEWYIDKQKHELETSLLRRSSLIFLGHEHWPAFKTSSFDNQSLTFIHCGGSLSNDNNWSESEFETGLFDTESHEYQSTIFRWNNYEKQYEIKSSNEQVLPLKPSNEKKLDVTEKYLNGLFVDANRFFSDSSMDYYVFPRMEKEVYDDSNSQEYLEMEGFIKEILTQKKIIITGANGSGKTSLLKALFLGLIEQGYYVIFCDIDTIKNKDSNKIVKTNFEEIYGDDISSYNRFIQLPPEKKVLIIDDIEQIRLKDFEKYISEQNEFFGLMIFSTNTVVDFDIISRVKTVLDTKKSIVKYKISPFYADKRKELIEKLVSLRKKKDDLLEVAPTVENLCDSINLQKKFITLTPEILITFVEYYCNNLGITIENDSSIFSKVFESSITQALLEHKKSNVTIDKLYKLLSMIAYYIHFNKKYPISEISIISIVEQYNNDFDDVVSPLDFIKTVNNAKILVLESDGYKFKNKNHLAYFCAREVNYLYNSTNNEDDLKYLVNCCCFGINADILMFISYITDNTRILQLFLDLTNELTNEWKEFDFEENCPHFLNISHEQLVAKPDEKTKQKKESREVELEKENNSLHTIDIYDYDEADAELLVNQIIRSVSLLSVIAKCLPGFEHNMNAEMRKDFVQKIYSLPNKIYYRWAQEVDSVYDVIIQELKKMDSVEYIDSSLQQKNEIETTFKTVASLLLLDIYNIGVSYATKDNSFRLLNKPEYNQKTTYAIEKLMVIEKRKESSQFVNSSISLFEHEKNPLPRFLIKNIVAHAYISMESLDYHMRDRLNSTFFHSKKGMGNLVISEQKKLLLKRSNNTKWE